MIFVGGSVIIQILAVLHVLKTGRERIWIWVIIFFSMLGCCAYFAFELMPEIFGPNSPRAIAKRTQAMRDPATRLRRAELELQERDTAAIRLDLAAAHADLGSHREAIVQYLKAMDHLRSRDARVEIRLAASYLAADEADHAFALIESIDTPLSSTDADKLSLLKARSLVELNRTSEASALYDELIERMSGNEAHCRFAALLLETGETNQALEILTQVEKRLTKQSRSVHEENADMHAWAIATLKDLRTA
jgi:hypothetical protein